MVAEHEIVKQSVSESDTVIVTLHILLGISLASPARDLQVFSTYRTRKEDKKRQTRKQCHELFIGNGLPSIGSTSTPHVPGFSPSQSFF